MIYNITTTHPATLAKRVSVGDTVSNGDTLGLYLGTTKRGVYVVAWGEKAKDATIVAKLSAYVARHQA